MVKLGIRDDGSLPADSFSNIHLLRFQYSCTQLQHDLNLVKLPIDFGLNYIFTY